MSGTYDAATLEKLHKAELDELKDFIAICDKYHIDYFAIAGTAIGTVRHGGFIPWDDDIDIAMLRKDYEKFIKVADKEFNGKYEMMGPDFTKKYYNLQPAMNKIGTKFITDGAWASKFEPGIFLDLFIFENIPEDEKEAAYIIEKCRRYKTLYIIRHVNFFKFIKGKSFVQKIKNIISGFLRLFLLLIPHSDEKLYNKYCSYAKKYYGKTNRYTALCDPGAKILCIDEEDIYPFVKMPFEDIEINLVNKYDKQLTKHMGNYMELPPEDKRTNHCPRKIDFGLSD